MSSGYIDPTFLPPLSLDTLGRRGSGLVDPIFLPPMPSATQHLNPRLGSVVVDVDVTMVSQSPPKLQDVLDAARVLEARSKLMKQLTRNAW